MQLVIKPDGLVMCLYGEELDLKQIGALTIHRGSHVEPDKASQWHADMSPVGGPCLGPFASRSDALLAERQWLENYWLTQTD